MKQAPALFELIEIDALRVGMHVHLEGGWMSHPFPLSSFKISNLGQIATIRSLGLTHVRWCPQQSDSAPMAPEPLEEAPATSTAAEPETEPASTPVIVSNGSAVAVSSTDRDQLIAQQREDLVLCESQFAEAVQDCTTLTALVSTQPQVARQQAEGLTAALLTKMLRENELCVRLLADAAGDQASTHAMNVTLISLMMGRRLGMTPEDMLDLGLGAMLHDIGSTELPEHVRFHDRNFGMLEARLYEQHVACGAAIGREMGLSVGAQQIIEQHHEHADGSGFPLRMKADRMSVAARIVSIVDSYDNLCNPPLAHNAVTPHEALSLLFARSQNKFDTSILSVFIKMMGVYPAGSTVQLTDDRYAMVMAVNSTRPFKPRVLVHHNSIAREEALVLDLESVPGLGIRRGVRPQLLPTGVLAYLAPPKRSAYFFEPARKAA